MWTERWAEPVLVGRFVHAMRISCWADPGLETHVLHLQVCTQYRRMDVSKAGMTAVWCLEGRLADDQMVNTNANIAGCFMIMVVLFSMLLVYRVFSFFPGRGPGVVTISNLVVWSWADGRLKEQIDPPRQGFETLKRAILQGHSHTFAPVSRSGANDHWWVHYYKHN